MKANKRNFVFFKTTLLSVQPDFLRVSVAGISQSKHGWWLLWSLLSAERRAQSSARGRCSEALIAADAAAPLGSVCNRCSVPGLPGGSRVGGSVAPAGDAVTGSSPHARPPRQQRFSSGDCHHLHRVGKRLSSPFGATGQFHDPSRPCFPHAMAVRAGGETQQPRLCKRRFSIRSSLWTGRAGKGLRALARPRAEGRKEGRRRQKRNQPLPASRFQQTACAPAGSRCWQLGSPAAGRAEEHGERLGASARGV